MRRAVPRCHKVRPQAVVQQRGRIWAGSHSECGPHRLGVQTRRPSRPDLRSRAETSRRCQLAGSDDRTPGSLRQLHCNRTDTACGTMDQAGRAGLDTFMGEQCPPVRPEIGSAAAAMQSPSAEMTNRLNAGRRSGLEIVTATCVGEPPSAQRPKSRAPPTVSPGVLIPRVVSVNGRVSGRGRRQRPPPACRRPRSRWSGSSWLPMPR